LIGFAGVIGSMGELLKLQWGTAWAQQLRDSYYNVVFMEHHQEWQVYADDALLGERLFPSGTKIPLTLLSPATSAAILVLSISGDKRKRSRS